VAKEFIISEGSKQFVKFCLIGASSALLDVSISRRLIDVFGMYWLYANTLSFAVAVTNGYLWNSLWTFRGLGAAGRHTQYLKFVAVNTMGYGLNILIMSLMFLLLTGHLHGNPPRPIWFAAKVTAIVLVAIWNFLANKRWTFAETRVQPPA
jgi:putative flippase GtrA